MRRATALNLFGAAMLLCGANSSSFALAQNAQERPKQPVRRVIDEVGRSVDVPAQVNRIVTLAPNLAEIIYALGAEDHLVGVSEYTDHPPAAKEKPSIGMPVNPSLEAIVGAKPDLVLATTSINLVKTVDTLARLGVPAYTTDPHTIEGTLRSITDIGDVIGSSHEATALVANLQARLDALQTKLKSEKPVRVLFVVWEQPLQSVGDNTFIADALHWAGAESAIHTKQNWPTISLEEVVKLNPDYIVYAENQMGDDSNGSSLPAGIRPAIARHLDELRNQPVWRDLSAVREGHIAIVDDEIQVPAPGLIDSIEQLARELHPAVFSPQSVSHVSSVPRTWHSIPSEAVSCVR
ncbi:MAG TPA: ABC transporter substrate-binding protein [Candidatus Acidoferrales bacterium]|nr:ABC transporter substrate-binding protein [Candidatus Acidoferrales bacterium]